MAQSLLRASSLRACTRSLGAYASFPPAAPAHVAGSDAFSSEASANAANFDAGRRKGDIVLAHCRPQKRRHHDLFDMRHFARHFAALNAANGR